MNPIPQDGGIPAVSLFANGYLDLLMLVALASVAVVLGMMLWSARDADRRRERIICPVRLRPARVVFGRHPMHVVRCSIFGRRPITCGKVCAARTKAA